MKRLALLTVALLLAGGAARVPAVTLGQCLDLARRNAPSVRAAQADVSRADQAIREARAALSPTLRLSSSLVENSEPQSTVFSFPGQPGTTIKIASATNLDTRLTGEYTLYSGGRNGALVRAAEASRAGRTRDRESADADLVLRVSEAYYRAIAAERLDAAAGEAVTTARAHATISAARVRAGVAGRVDSLRARGDLLLRSSAQVRATEAVRLARVELESAVGSPLPDSTLADPVRPSLDVPDVSSATQAALGRRPELAALDEALRENGLRHDAALAGRRPTVNLSATAQYLGPNRNEAWWDTDMPGLRTDHFFAGVALSMPLYDAGLTQARAGELASERNSLESRRREVELSVRRDVEKAISDLRVAQATWQSDSSRVVTAREALTVAAAAYKGGTGGATDVRDAESALADASGDEAQSSMNYWIARAELEHAIGATAGKGR